MDILYCAVKLLGSDRVISLNAETYGICLVLGKAKKSKKKREVFPHL